jgi:hypothetical protein
VLSAIDFRDRASKHFKDVLDLAFSLLSSQTVQENVYV